MSDLLPGNATAHKGVTVIRPRQAGSYLMAKRILDYAVALAMLVLLLPLLAIIALAIKMDSPGPVLYRGIRVGRLGAQFTVLKFRSMAHQADDTLHRHFVQQLLQESCENGGASTAASTGVYKVQDDPRVTRVGRFLRLSSLDELPQLINVLRGEMSLVGPRPEVPYALGAYEPWQRRRFDVLPGLTGLWQVSGRSRLPPAEMLRLDVRYAEECCFWLDCWILLRTLPALLEFDQAG